MSSTEALTTEIEPLSPSDPTDSTSSPESPTTTESLIFKAVGIVRGEVNFSDESHATVTLNQKQYPLFYSRSRPALSGLRQEIEKIRLPIHLSSYSTSVEIHTMPTEKVTWLDG